MGQRAYLSVFVATFLLSGACNHEDPGLDGGVDAGDADLSVIPSLDAACAIGGAKAMLRRLNLVVIYDRSGSMGDPAVGGDATLRWIPVGEGLKAFFTDADSLGVNATLQYFPYKQNPLEACNSSAYFFPDVPLTALPSTVFGDNIAMTSPQGETPTYPAVQGAIAAAQKIAKDDTNAKVAIILVTDGEPNSCGSSVQNTSGALSAVAATIPTYVIGVGPSQQAIIDIATAGGAGPPVFVSVGDPAQTRADILTALTKIRGQQLACEFALPPPPAGMVLDTDKVNVLYTPSMGAQQALGYDPACSTGNGWHYDDAMNPTKVILCPGTCGTVQKDKGAAIDILFGCQTIGIL
jgi:hypothetical protein